MRRREKIFWLVVGAIFVVGFVALIPAHGEICKESQKTGEQACASYRLVPFLVIQIGKILDALGVAITALATIAIAWFTLSLRRSTDRLWYAGERSAIVQRNIGEAQVRAYVSIKSANIYFIGDDALPFIEMTASNSGQSPAIEFVWAPEVYYLSDKAEEVVKDVHPEWADQPGLDIHSASETSSTYVLDDFILTEKIAIDGVVPDRIGVSVTVHYTWTDVFGESFKDYASFAGMAVIGDAKANRKRHPMHTSAWSCRLSPIAKGQPWSGIAVQAPSETDDED